MHHALEIQEILLNTFGHCYPGDLPSLARTCHTFKEPALDVLWEELDDLSPLVRCLPEASHQLSLAKYSFSRPLTQTEWNILQSYTRRIRSMRDVRRKLDETSFRILSDTPTTEPLFPSLRKLSCQYKTKCRLLSHFPLPTLISLEITENPHCLQDSFDSVSLSSPNIRQLLLNVGQSDVTFGELVSKCICRWQNLQIVTCPEISLDVNALVHLSRMPALTKLHFALSATLPDFDSPLSFSDLHRMTPRSKSLEAISRLLSQIRLPAIMNFTVIVDDYPSRKELSFFFVGVQASIAGNAIKVLLLHQASCLPSNAVRSEALLLCLEDLRPCMAFNSLLRLSLDIEWNVGLTDSELLTLASAWPYLEYLAINEHWGWNSLGGITPNGLLQLLQKCPSLACITLAIDTRGYIELPSNGSLASLGLTSPRTMYFDVLDSIIEAESVTAIAAFFACPPCSNFFLTAWAGRGLMKPPGWEVYKDRWNDVHRLGWAKRAAIQGS